VIAGQKDGRIDDDKVTVYKSLGLAVQVMTINYRFVQLKCKSFIWVTKGVCKKIAENVAKPISYQN
jgi:hypothetical protein